MTLRPTSAADRATFPSDEEVEDAVWPRGRPVPHKIVRCRHCGHRNRLVVSRAVLSPERVFCGGCRAHLFLSYDAPLTDLASDAYQHTLDRRTLRTLRAVPGFPRLVRWMLRQVSDRTAHLLFMSDAIRCGDDQFPELLGLLDLARTRLGVTERPTLFLGESPHMNALTTGVDTSVIVVRSALLDQMGDDEVVAILGHELGHLHAQHPLYQTVATILLSGGIGVSAAVRVVGAPLRRALLSWTRAAELTADRAALLASRDLRACINVMLTLAGGNRPGTSGRTRMRLAPFIAQCRELARHQAIPSFDSLLGTYLTMDRTHPHMALRVTNLIQWVEYGNYLDILAGDYIRAPRRLTHG